MATRFAQSPNVPYQTVWPPGVGYRSDFRIVRDGEVESFTRHLDQLVENHPCQSSGVAVRRVIRPFAGQSIDDFLNHQGD
jgi:hypothetical protein